MKANPTRAFLPTLLPVSSWVTMEGNELASARVELSASGLRVNVSDSYL